MKAANPIHARTPTEPAASITCLFGFARHIPAGNQRLDDRKIKHRGVKDRGFMDSIYFTDSARLLIDWLLSLRTAPWLHPADVLFEAHKIRVSRGDYNIAEIHLADAIEALMTRKNATLSEDRSPKNPY